MQQQEHDKANTQQEKRKGQKKRMKNRAFVQNEEEKCEQTLQHVRPAVLVSVEGVAVGKRRRTSEIHHR